MLRVDRQNYVPEDVPEFMVYLTRPLPIGLDETISAPNMHAVALEALASKLQPGARVLDVGSGSGYLAACFAYACERQGRVLGMEEHPELVRRSIDNIAKADGELLETGELTVRAGNVLTELKPDCGLRFDAIHVGAAAETLPQPLCDILAPGGLMLIPVGPEDPYSFTGQVLMLVEREMDPAAEPQFLMQTMMDVRYVPLTPAPPGA